MLCFYFGCCLRICEDDFPEQFFFISFLMGFLWGKEKFRPNNNGRDFFGKLGVFMEGKHSARF